MQKAEAKIDIIVQAAKKFYIDNLSQVEIAQELGISRPTVSRLLKKAVDTGVVDIHINDVSYALLRLSEQLSQRMGLHNAIIVKGNDNNLPAVMSEAAYAAAGYFASIVHDQDLIGMSHGTTVFKMLDYIRPLANISVNAVQLQGNSSLNMPYVQGSYIVTELARILGGTAYAMHAPLSVRSKILHDLLLEEEYMRQHYSLFDRLNIAMVGIGTGELAYEDEALFSFSCPPEVACNICNLFFNVDGKLLDTEYQHHSIGIPYEQLTRVPEVIGVAVGARKKDAVLAALRTGLITTLVTDERIAAYILSATA